MCATPENNALTIIAKRWFQQSYGNTYHSVEVSRFDGEKWVDVGRVPFRYGYGEQFIATAAEILGIDERDLLRDIRDHESPRVFINVTDVNRKRDL